MRGKLGTGRGRRRVSLAITPDLWQQAKEHWGDTPLLITPQQTWSFQKFLENSATLAALLPQQPETRIGFSVAHPEQLLPKLFACWMRRLVAVPLNPALPESQRLSLFKQVGCQEMRTEVIPKKSLPPDSSPTVDLGAPALVVFTSGSTGTPKAVALSLENFLWSAEGANQVMPLKSGDRWLLSLPLHHVGGLAIVFRTLLAGAALVIPANRHDLARTIATQGITHLSLVPTQLHRLLQTAEGCAALQRLKLILLGGALIPEPLLQQAGELGLPVFASYGCTELASQVATGPLRKREGRWETAAAVLPHRELRIDESGAIHVRGKTRFLGYLTDSGLQQPFDAEGWFATGDLGRWDGERLEVLGRKDAMFITGGENVHPERIERKLLAFPGVEQAIVVAVEDAEFGARPVAFVRMAVGICFPDEQSFRSFLQARLVGFEVPDLFLPWPEPLHSGLKPRRLELAKLAQPHFNRCVQQRPFRNWLKQHPPGWKRILRCGERQVFEVVDHGSAEPRGVFVLADLRQTVMEWLLDAGNLKRLLDGTTGIPVSWHPVPQAITRSVRERIEIVRLLEDDPHPVELEAWDARNRERLTLSVVTTSGPSKPLWLPLEFRELSVSTESSTLDCLVEIPADLFPETDHRPPEQVLQFGVCIPELEREYLIRTLFRNEASRQRFLGWKVQLLRETDGTEREQPFWDIPFQEEQALEAIIRQLLPIDSKDWERSNTPECERVRRREFQVRLEGLLGQGQS